MFHIIYVVYIYSSNLSTYKVLFYVTHTKPFFMLYMLQKENQLFKIYYILVFWTKAKTLVFQV